MEARGLEFVGRDTTGERMEVFELSDHPFFVGAQVRAARHLAHAASQRTPPPTTLRHPLHSATACTPPLLTARPRSLCHFRVRGARGVARPPQYHPEFKSRPLNPSPLFYGLICAATGIVPERPEGLWEHKQKK